MVYLEDNALCKKIKFHTPEIMKQTNSLILVASGQADKKLFLYATNYTNLRDFSSL